MDLAFYLAAALTAFGLSLSHCVFMCGGFAIMLGKGAKIAKLLIYHLFRVLAYMILGASFGLAGRTIILSGVNRGLIFFAVGVFLIVLAVALFQRGRFLALFESQKLTQKTVDLAKKAANHRFGVAILGFLNGLLPCGVVYYFLAMSVSAGSILNGVFLMGFFGVITAPTLILTAFGTKIISQKYQKIASVLTAILMALSGVYLAFLGFMAV